MTKGTKINQLLLQLPKNAVVLASWMESEGYSFELQQRYRKSGWFKSIGRGAMLRVGDNPVLAGAIYTLQNQAGMDIHIGGRSAFDILGLSQYMQLNAKQLMLFTESRLKLPTWLLKNTWDYYPLLYRISLFEEKDCGLVEYNENTLKQKISGSARAIMECLALCPSEFSLLEAYEIMEGLNNLRPSQVQTLLVQCKSIKVKRLFLYFAEKAGHSWVKYIDMTDINLGVGKRSLVSNGFYVAKYQLVLPKDLV
jgi:hypothetical protein